MSELSRWFETVRRLRPSQVAHRVTLRYGSRRPSGSTPAWRGIAPLPLESRRPRAWPYDHVEKDGWRLAGRLWPFDARGGEVPDPAPTSLPLLARYHAGYGEWTRALAEDGHMGLARSAIERWFAAGAREDPETAHAYVRSRRILALVEARMAGLVGCEAIVAADASVVDARIERDVRGNHLVANAAALYRAGCAFAGGPARRWLERGAALLAEAARTQVLADGFHYERSAEYHALVLEHFLIGLECAAARGEVPPRGLEEAARAMAEVLQDLVLPDGARLRWKDGAPGLSLPTDGLLRWAVRRAGPLRPPRRGTRAFESAGLVILESPDGRSTATLLAGPACPDELPAHGHADALAYEAVFDGARIVASAGTADYAAGPGRDRDRLPGAFAGVLVDGHPPADPYGAFRVGARGWVRDLRSGYVGSPGAASASSDGFTQTVGERIGHRRALSLSAGPTLVVVDEWTGRGAHELDLFLPLAPGVAAEARGSSAVVRDGRSGGKTWGLATSGLSVTVESGSFATGLGTTVERAVLRAKGRLSFPARVAHAWTPDRPASRITATPVIPSDLRIEVEAADGTRTCFVPGARRP